MEIKRTTLQMSLSTLQFHSISYSIIHLVMGNVDHVQNGHYKQNDSLTLNYYCGIIKEFMAKSHLHD